MGTKAPQQGPDFFCDWKCHNKVLKFFLSLRMLQLGSEIFLWVRLTHQGSAFIFVAEIDSIRSWNFICVWRRLNKALFFDMDKEASTRSWFFPVAQAPQQSPDIFSVNEVESPRLLIPFCDWNLLNKSLIFFLWLIMPKFKFVFCEWSRVSKAVDVVDLTSPWNFLLQIKTPQRDP